MMSESTDKQFIFKVVESFYAKATIDPIIGYHFRKIQQYEGIDPLRPPLEAFSHHLPRIATFWEIQLLDQKTEVSPPFQLIATHKALHIRKGELGRWLTLFKETLNQYHKSNLTLKWREKLEHFEEIFQRKLWP